MPALTGGTVVYRFTAATTVTLRYALTRRVAAGVAGAVRLVQHSEAAIVTASTPWVPSPASMGTAVHSLSVAGDSVSEDTTCQITTAAGTCGDVQYTVAPFAPGRPFGDFQSQPGTGVSQPITVTFSQPVNTVNVTLVGGSYEGNEAIAYDTAGNVVAQVSFGYHDPNWDPTPWEDPRVLTGNNNIMRVELTPAPRDYVGYKMSITVRKPCPPFKKPSEVTDSLLQNPLVQHVLDSLARATGWNKTFKDQRELGGFFVQKNGVIRFVPYDPNSGVPPGPCLSGPGPTQIPDLQAAGDTILAQVHTHPKYLSRQQDPGNCWTLDNKGQLVHMQQEPDGTLPLRKGPSKWDTGRWKEGSNPPKYEGLLAEPGQITRWEKDANGKFHQKSHATSKCFGGQQ